MLIVDAQVHVWKAGKASAHHSRGRPDPFTLADLQVEMRAAGVDAAVLAPPSWDPNGNAVALEHAQLQPDRFVVTGEIDWHAAPEPERVRNWCQQPGMHGLRLIFNTPDKQAVLAGGSVDWIWQAAERADVPAMLLVPGGVPLVGAIAQRFPGLRLCVDHLGIPRGATDEAAFAHLPQLLALARYANVSVKAGGLPAYSTRDAFPYPSLHGYLRQVYDAFGPERIFWASDLTRMSCDYREVVTLFTEGIPWLTGEDLRQIMGESVCRWLNWNAALERRAGATMTMEAQPRLTANQWKVVSFCALGGMLETMDIYIIGFVLTVISGPWGLSYGQSAAILYASGIGAIVGSFVWGYIADRVGRKKAFVGTILVCSLASVVLAFTPSGDWVFVALMRAIIGFGAAGFFIFVMIVQEFAPAANRGFASSFVSMAAAGGLLVGALASSFLMPIIGWRGMFAIGALPIFVGIAVIYFMPESPRWALAHGKVELGRRSLAWALGSGADMEKIVLAYSRVEKPPGWGEVIARRRSFLVGTLINFGVVTGYYGITLWAPTLLSQVLSISGAEAARIMVVLSLTGLLSRLLMGWLADRVGRRRCGAVAACGAAIFLVIAGLVGHGDLLSPGLFWLPFGLAFVFADSGFAIMGMYTSEIWPSRLRGRGSGVCYAAGSVGKIVGPLGLALLIGSSNMIRPAATVNAIVPAFVFLGAVFLIAGVTYVFVARETRGESLEDLDRKLA